MTAREIGSGLSRMSRHNRRTVAGRAAASRKKTKMSTAERRHLGQLVVCAAVFVSIVAGRLLLPQRMAGISASLRGMLGQTIDVQEVFSAVGRAVSGKESVSESMGDVYQAVFGPDEGQAVETAATVTRQRAKGLEEKHTGASPETAAPETNEAVDPNSQPAGDGGAATGQTESSDETTPLTTDTTNGQLSAVTLVYSNLPKNVCMEQQILGFSYTTPVVGALSSTFGYREHPIEGEEKFHYGVDLAVAEGTAIGSFADGTVTAVGESSSLGKYIIIEHGNGYSTLYAHCSKITASSGAAVTKGQKVAEAGQTGLATGPHCHFELHRDSNYLNPIYYVETA